MYLNKKIWRIAFLTDEAKVEQIKTVEETKMCSVFRSA